MTQRTDRSCIVEGRIPTATLRIAAYSMVAVAGVGILLVPAERYQGIINALHLLWGVLALAGIPATIGVITGRFRWEWAALTPMAMSVAIYAFLSWLTVAQDVEHLTRAALLTALSAGFLAQFFSIWRRVVKARKTARRLRGDPA